MMTRCYTPSSSKFYAYGARGIRVCHRWHSFKNFLEDMGETIEGFSLDRIDVNGDYSPENCRWADKYVQARNKTTNRIVTAFGKSQVLSDWAKEVGMDPRKIGDRLRRGWSPERAVAP